MKNPLTPFNEPKLKDSLVFESCKLLYKEINFVLHFVLHSCLKCHIYILKMTLMFISLDSEKPVVMRVSKKSEVLCVVP